MYNLYDDLDYLIEQEIPLETLLYDNNITFEQALSAAKQYRSEFAKLAQNYGIVHKLSCPERWLAVLKLPVGKAQYDLLVYLISDCSLLFEQQDDEGIVLSYLMTKQKQEWLTRELENYIDNHRKWDEFSERVHKLKYPTSGRNSENYRQVFTRLYEEGYADNADKDVLLQNLASLDLLIESNEELKRIAPLVYYQVLVHNHRKLFEKADFIVNPKTIFRYENYSIEKDNGKNFEQYERHCELYILLKECFPETDKALCDAGFLRCSNLAQWCYENFLPSEDMPLTLAAIIAESKTLLFDDIELTDGYSYEDIIRLREKYAALNRKAHKAANLLTFEDTKRFIANRKAVVTEVLERSELLKTVKAEQFSLLIALTLINCQGVLQEMLDKKICEVLSEYTNFCYKC